MLTVVVVIGVLGILFGSAALATYEGPVLIDPHPDRRDVGLPDAGVQPEDIGDLRFDMTLRGYRMSEVDGVLDRLAGELANRDSRISQLESALAEALAPHVAEAERQQTSRFSKPEPEVDPEPEPTPQAEPTWDPVTSWTPVTHSSAAPLTAATDEEFGFPELALPDAADAALPEATDDAAPATQVEPEPAPESSWWLPPVGAYDQSQAESDDVPAPVVEDVEQDAQPQPQAPDPEAEPAPPWGAPGTGAAPSGEAAEGH